MVCRQALKFIKWLARQPWSGRASYRASRNRLRTGSAGSVRIRTNKRRSSRPSSASTAVRIPCSR